MKKEFGRGIEEGGVSQGWPQSKLKCENPKTKNRERLGKREIINNQGPLKRGNRGGGVHNSLVRIWRGGS